MLKWFCVRQTDSYCGKVKTSDQYILLKNPVLTLMQRWTCRGQRVGCGWLKKNKKNKIITAIFKAMHHQAKGGSEAQKLFLEAPRKFCSVWVSSSSRCPEVDIFFSGFPQQSIKGAADAWKSICCKALISCGSLPRGQRAGGQQQKDRGDTHRGWCGDTGCLWSPAGVCGPGSLSGTAGWGSDANQYSTPFLEGEKQTSGSVRQLNHAGGHLHPLATRPQP